MTTRSNLLQLLPETPVPLWQLTCVGVGAGVLFVSLAVAVAGHGPGSIDQSIHAWAGAHRGDASSALARGIARTGSSRATLPVLVLVGAVAPVVKRSVPLRLASGLLLAGVTGLGIAVGIAINASIARGRPDTGALIAGSARRAMAAGQGSATGACGRRR